MEIENRPLVDRPEHAAIPLIGQRPDLFARQGSGSSIWRRCNGML